MNARSAVLLAHTLYVCVCVCSHIFIVSFEQLLSDSNRRKLLSQKKWRRVIIDEGHNIRNKNGKRMKALRALKTDCRWSITGE